MEGEAAREGDAETAEAKTGFFRRYAALWPMSAGLACAYLGLRASSSGVFAGTNGSAYTDIAGLIALIPILAVAIFMNRSRKTVGRSSALAVGLAAICIEFASVLAMGVLRFFSLCTFASRFTLCALVALSAVVAMSFWLRRAHGADMATAAVLVFSAIALSEAAIFLIELLPDSLRCLVAAPVVLLQLPCHFALLRFDALPETPVEVDDYYAFVSTGAANRRFLAACAVGLGFIALVSGFLCGLPGDAPLAIPVPISIVSLLVGEALALGFIAFTVRQKTRTMTIGIWIALELVAAASLVLYAALPNDPAAGSAAASLLTALMMALTWHLVVAFSTSGRLDPFYYTALIWSICTGCHGIGRFTFALLPLHGNIQFAVAIVGFLLLISTQIVLVRMIDIARFAALNPRGRAKLSEAEKQPDEAEAHASALERLFGLDEEAAVADVRQAAMLAHAKAIGAQFLLSEREIEVLALYTSGLTQKRVAEQLHVSQTTAHTHITRIYAKTGMHSRQELLDYIHNYLER